MDGLEQTRRSTSTRRRRVVAVAIALAAPILAPAVALAVISFSDVPPSHYFYADVQAIAEKGVTLGCGNGKFCPDRYVTRGQMAAFLNRLGALAPDKTPVVNADKVDGLDSTALLVGTAPIPAGVTVTGYGGYDHSVIVDNGDVIVTVPLPAPAPMALSGGVVNFAAHADVADDDAACTGTAAAPTAPAGKVCIYLGSHSGIDGAQGWSAEQTGFNDRAFLVQVLANGAPGNDLYFRFSWAYTAPDLAISAGSGSSETLSKE
jgi:hypothetical protein